MILLALIVIVLAFVGAFWIWSILAPIVLASMAAGSVKKSRSRQAQRKRDRWRMQGVKRPGDPDYVRDV